MSRLGGSSGRERSFSNRGSLVPLIAVLTGLVTLGAMGGEAAGAGSFPREQQDDPPGILTQRRTGPAARPQAGPFSSVQVNVDANGANILQDAANEPSIAVDPTNPNHIAIGWRQFDTIFSNFRQAGRAWSDDGGRTWSFPGPLTPGVFRSDPVLGYDANGTFYYSSLETDFSTDLFVSTNGGASWDGPFYSYGGDKQWIQVDRTGGLGNGHIYQAWSTAAGCCGTNIFNRSSNGGTSFSAPVTIPTTPIWGTMDVTASGILWVAGVDPNDFSRFLVARSSNARDPLSVPTFDFTRTFSLGGAIAVQVPDSPNPAGLLGQVWLAIDRGNGPRAGWMYVVASVDPVGTDPMDVHFSRSTDGGQTWSAPVRINTDLTLGWQWFATMSLSPNGRIDVVWNDTRASGFSNLCELYTSSSNDGGTTWSPNTLASPQWNSHAGWPNQQKIGDYYHMISDNVGANLAWAATFNSEQDVYYLRLGDYDCNGNGIGDATDIAQHTSQDSNANGIPDECEPTSDVAWAPARTMLHQNVPNPFNPRTSIAFDLPQAASGVCLRVHDLQGRLVRTLLAGASVAAGPTTVDWDGRDERGNSVASGLYVYRLEAPGVAASRKMMLLR
ncbi:MAG TPA: FlgD immunoglobulin-like domain containing protein [Candidatus Krumholzibacteria bacterium]|nr:FlgD immunoglobulin-like domain containing protein [Candidatus Krumholzibacteria bacterium]